MPKENVNETDVLVIGGGMAGIFAAIKAKEEGVNVTLVDKGYVSRSGATAFGGDCFSVFNPEWGHDMNGWKAQVNMAGEYLNDPEWTEISLKDSYERCQDLLSWGVEFRKDTDGEFAAFKQEGGLEAIFMSRGWIYLPILRQRALKNGINIIDRIMVTDLLKQEGRVTGAIGFHTRSGELYIFKAKATVICTGNGNFRTIRGSMISNLSLDGETMAYRAGAEISGREFAPGGVYYEKEEDTRISLEGKAYNKIPTTYPMWVNYGPHTSFISKYVDAEGYALGRYTAATAVHEGRAPLLYNLDAATSDELERVSLEIEETGTAYRLERVGIDLAKGGLWMGMVRAEEGIGYSVFGGGGGISSVNTQCATSLPGLYAAGDVYASKAVGAAYPALGFALRNAAVTGARAGWGAAKYASKVGKITIGNEELARLKKIVYAPLERKGGFDTDWVTKQLQNILFPYYVWLIKHGERMKAALTLIEFLKNHIAPKIYAKDAHGLCRAHEAKSRILGAEIMLRSSIFRTESRGSHYREDHPRRDDPGWLASVHVKEKDGQMEVVKKPLPKKWWPDLSKSYKERYPKRFLGEE